MIDDLCLPNSEKSLLDMPVKQRFTSTPDKHPSRILLLYGCLQKRSFSYLAVEAAARILMHFGAIVKIFTPRGFPLTNTKDTTKYKVQELQELTTCKS